MKRKPKQPIYRCVENYVHENCYYCEFMEYDMRGKVVASSSIVLPKFDSKTNKQLKSGKRKY